MVLKQDRKALARRECMEIRAALHQSAPRRGRRGRKLCGQEGLLPRIWEELLQISLKD